MQTHTLALPVLPTWLPMSEPTLLRHTPRLTLAMEERQTARRRGGWLCMCMCMWLRLWLISDSQVLHCVGIVLLLCCIIACMSYWMMYRITLLCGLIITITSSWCLHTDMSPWLACNVSLQLENYSRVPPVAGVGGHIPNNGGCVVLVSWRYDI